MNHTFHRAWFLAFQAVRALLGPAVLVLAGWGGAAIQEHEGKEVPLGLPRELLAGARTTVEQVRLGERLFFDAILSSDRSVSCAACHQPEHAFADTRPFSEGVDGRRTLRNTPTILNRALGRAFMWDGRARTLEEQVLLPIQNELEMDLTLPVALARLGADESYRNAFEAAFGGMPTEQRLSAALAAFVHSKLQGGTRVDRFRAGERNVLTAAERGGMWIFESKGGCWRCHSGPNFSDEEFHNTGIGSVNGLPEAGRFGITGKDDDRGRFKTPTLRALTRTSPYMHDGSLETLEDVVEFYRNGGKPNAGLDPVMGTLELSDRDAANLAAFLRALSNSNTD